MRLGKLLYPDVVVPILLAVGIIWAGVIGIRDFPAHKGAETMTKGCEAKVVELSLTLTASVRIRGSTDGRTRATTVHMSLADCTDGLEVTRENLALLAERGIVELSPGVLADIGQSLQEAGGSLSQEED